MKRSSPTPREPQSFLKPTAAGTGAIPSRTVLAVAACMASFIFAVYSPSLKFQFVLDDHRFTADPRIQQPGHLFDYFTSFVWAQFTGGAPSFYRPVFLLWMRINFILSELSPWGWHLLSIAKHVLVAGLLGLLVWRLLRDWTAVLVAAALFALHPAQTESVSWVTVPDPLMAAGVLGALLCYFRYMQGAPAEAKPRGKKSRRASASNAPRQSAVWLVASAAAYFVAALAKETAIVFPVVIFALGVGAERGEAEVKGHSDTRSDDFVPRIVRAFRQVLPFVVATAIYLLARLNALPKLMSSTQHLSWSTVVLSWPATLSFYLKVLLWPVRSYGFADPNLVDTFSAHDVLLPLLTVVVAAAILAGGLFWAMAKAQRELSERESAGVRCALIAGSLLLVMPLLLTLNLNALNPGDFLHGRYTYLPLAGLMLLLATGWRLTGEFRFVLWGVAGVLTIAFAALTFSQQAQWKDDATVFTVAHQLAPNNGPVAKNLADTHVQAALRLAEEDQCDQAIPVFEQVIEQFPKDWYAWAGLGSCFVQMDQLVKAEESFHRAADLSHEPRVIQQWQELRTHMGLPNSIPEN